MAVKHKATIIMEGKISHANLRKAIRSNNLALLIRLSYANSVLDRVRFYL